MNLDEMYLGTKAHRGGTTYTMKRAIYLEDEITSPRQEAALMA